MRSYWLTGWLLVVLLACSAVEPRAAMADAPRVAPSTAPEPDGKPATPPADPAERQFRAVFTLSGYTRAQKIEELSAGWSPRKQLLVRATEFAGRTTQSLTRARAAASVLYPVVQDIGGLGIAAGPALAAPSYPLLPLHQWLQVLCLFALVAVVGLAIPVLWLIRAQASRGAPGH